MLEFFENAIKIIEELIVIRTKEISILSDMGYNDNVINAENKKKIIALQFKLKYYRIWIKALHGCLTKNIIIKHTSDITNLKFTKKLEEKLVELFETGVLVYLEDARKHILELEQ